MRNTFIQGTLSIVFVSLATIGIVTAVLATVKSLRAGTDDGSGGSEDPYVRSQIYAPSG